MSQLLLTLERSFWSTWRRITYFGLDQTEERLIPISMGDLSKTNKLQTLAHADDLESDMRQSNEGAADDGEINGAHGNYATVRISSLHT